MDDPVLCGSRESAVGLLWGIIKAMRTEANEQDEDEVYTELSYLMAGVLDTIDRLEGTDAT